MKCWILFALIFKWILKITSLSKFFIDDIASTKSELNTRSFNIGLIILQWRAVTTEAGHAVGMPKLVVKCNSLWVGQKIMWDFKTKTKFCPKTMMFAKKKVFT